MSHLAFEQAIRSLFPAGVAVAVAGPGPHSPSAWREEEMAISAARPGRQAEFRAGRACARAALSSLGLAPQAIGRGPDRLPLWPDGAAGTITHCAGLCAAAVVRTTLLRSIGLDAEPAVSLSPELRPIVTRAEEVSSLERLELASADGYLLAFSAKEAFYKAYYPLTRTFLDFQDVALDLQADNSTSGAFTARLIDVDHPDAALAAALLGRWRLLDSHLLCAAFLSV